MTALEKFIEAMNKTSGFWVKSIEIHAQDGKVVFIRCDGFCFKGDIGGANDKEK